MAASKIGIVYASGSKMIRRIIIPDSDEQLRQTNWIGSGESLLEAVLPADGGRVESIEAYARQQVEAATGEKCADLVCAVVGADNKVESLIKADPAIDTLPDKEVVEAYSEKIITGATYDKATGDFILPARIEEAYTYKDEQGNDVEVPEKQIPEERIEKPKGGIEPVEPVEPADTVEGG